MGALLRIRAIFVVTVKRLWAQRGLASATLAGLVTAVALTMSVPLYADAVYNRLLHAGLFAAPDRDVVLIRPAFAMMFRYLGGWDKPVEWEDIQAVDQYFTTRASRTIDLPTDLLVRFFETDAFQVFAQNDVAYANVRRPLTWVTFGMISNVQDHIDVLEGAFPADAGPGDTVDVLVSQAMAEELGLQVGEAYVAFDAETADGGTAQIPIRIAGVWTPTDPKDQFWFFEPSVLETTVLITEASYRDRLSPVLREEVYEALWYLILDGSDVHANHVSGLLRRINTAWRHAGTLLPGMRLPVSPVGPLQEYQRRSGLLTLLLYAFSVPILGLVLAFVGLVVGLAVARQSNQMAILRSRGATTFQVVGIAAVEALVLGAIALALGSGTGQGIAYTISKARSFLNFSLDSELQVAQTATAFRFGLAAVGLAVAAQVLPSIGAAQHTVITYKQERARSLRPPWWQRVGLDVLLLLPAGYGLYVLRQQGTIALPVAGQALQDEFFQNPLLFLVPSLGVFAISLFLVRVLPWTMALAAWLASHTRSVGMLLAARHLSRTPGFYSSALILLVLTLSLSTYTASLAQTLDRHLIDQEYYRYGADVSMAETGEQPGSDSLPPGATPPLPGSDEARWFFLPVTEHLKLPGVTAATRVGRYSASAQLSGAFQTGDYVGIDRIDFPSVAFWRTDFAPQSLGALMNALALRENGVLVPRRFLAQNSLKVGDTFQLSVNVTGVRVTTDVEIVGAFDFFPTWYPEEQWLFVGNLDTLFENAGGEVPYHVWLETVSDVDYTALLDGVHDLHLRVIDWDAPPLTIEVEQRRPERQGLFGLLSVGFAAAALLTVAGFLLYALFSFQRRFIEMGMLRAIGLSSPQMTSFLAWELAFLILTGLIVGTGLGITISRLFIPYLQVGAEAAARIPPFVVEIAWPAILRIYAIFGLLFVLALGGLAALLLRMKVFQAIKLGETT